MDLSNLRPAKGSKHNNFRKGRGHGSGTRDRKHVPAHQGQASKAARCHYTGESPSVASPIGTPRISLR